MPQLRDSLFYEVMWRLQGRSAPYPFSWWVRQYLREWVDFFDSGLFDSKENAFASNAYYRYWNMIGEPDCDTECLVGQGGELEPVHNEYCLSFFLFDPATKTLHFPQSAGSDGLGSTVTQAWANGSFPVMTTQYQSNLGITVSGKAYGTAIAPGDSRTFIMLRLTAAIAAAPVNAMLGVAITPVGPSGFQRVNNAGKVVSAARLTLLNYIAGDNRVEINNNWGPSFDIAPASLGLYGNGSSQDPDFYLANNPFNDLATTGTLNGSQSAQDQVAGMGHGVFLWPLNLTTAAPQFKLNVRLPIGNFVTVNDLHAMAAVNADGTDTMEAAWQSRLFDTGAEYSLPLALQKFSQQDALCRSHLLILADGGEIHPGPTIYNSFWIRDSSVEGIACALVGQEDLAEIQFGTHYPKVFNQGPGPVNQYTPALLNGFFGGDHEKNDSEWDSNGEALWAFGRFDRIKGVDYQFGAGVFNPYVLLGSRWIRDNRSQFGLLYSGWSAEHLGDKNHPHYWDDLWAVAGLYEACRLAERINAPQQAELWQAYQSVVDATANSIRWVIGAQRDAGQWQTFIPTGPADVNELNSTIIGGIAYFHPCRLYMGSKLGADIDLIMRNHLETVWGNFVVGGFRHDSAWNAYGPYLTLQLAHAFLLIGQVERMAVLLDWVHDNAGRPTVGGAPAVIGVWNEQHCYPVATDFQQFPGWSWYMGDMPHGWACAEFILLLRDMLFFEADEDGSPHIFLLPGIQPARVADGEVIRVQRARTIFGGQLDFQASLDTTARQITIQFNQHPRADISYIYQCQFGPVISAAVDGTPITAAGTVLTVPAGTKILAVFFGPA